MKPARHLILLAATALPALAFAPSANGQPANEKAGPAPKAVKELSRMVDSRFQKVARDYSRRMSEATRVSIQFMASETLGGNGNADDLARALREKIYRDAARECETLERAFEKECKLSRLNITPARNAQVQDVLQFRGNAQFMLMERADAKAE